MRFFYTLLLVLIIATTGCESSDDDPTSPIPQPEINHPPGDFSLLAIPDNETNVILNPELKWEASIDPDSDDVTYDILLSADSQNPDITIALNISATNYLINNTLQFNTFYSWQVIAKDRKGASTKSPIYSFSTRALTIGEATHEAAFSTRDEHGVVSFKNKLWVIGGYHASNGGVNGGLLNDVWSSSDGINWEEIVPNDSPSSFPPRAEHTVTVFDDKLWVIGGGGLNGLLNDVWYSTDGINWTEATSSAAFSKRYKHTTVAFNDKLWLIGGRNSSNENEDIWSSPDGLNWILENETPPFLARFDHSCVVFNDRIWIIGGINYTAADGEMNDVWSSADGKIWQNATLHAGFSERFGHSSVAYKDKIWVIGGSEGNGLNDIWSSSDGSNWKQEIHNTNFPGRMWHSSTTSSDKIWTTGGWSTGSLLNDVWFFE